MNARWCTTRSPASLGSTAKAKARSRSAASWCCLADTPTSEGSDAAIPTGFRAAAEALFGAQLAVASHYARLLVTAGIERGLLGPREGERIWERHLLNSAVIAELIPDGARLIDVGSGAGLPGIPVALTLPASQVLLLEPMARRCAFLEDVVQQLGLDDRVTVMRGRAPDDSARLPFFADYALARAVAPLPRLVSWTMPVVRPGGELLAMRGQHAKQELQEAGPGLAQPRAAAPTVVELGADLLGAPVRVVRVQRSATERRSDTRGRGRRSSRGSQRFT